MGSIGSFISDAFDDVSDIVSGGAEILDDQLGFDPNGGGFTPVYNAIGASFGVPNLGTTVATGSGLAQDIFGDDGLFKGGGGSGSGDGLGNIAQAGLAGLAQQQNNLKLDEISDEMLAILDRAMQTQTDQAQQGIDFQLDQLNKGENLIQSGKGQATRELRPFAQVGRQNLSNLNQLVNDPQAQADFIQNNPFFETLANDAQSRVFKNQASRGKLGSGDTAKALQNELLKIGSDLLQRDIGNKQNLTGQGFNASSNIAQAIGNSNIAQAGLGQRASENISGTRRNLGNVLSNLLQQQGSVIGTELSGQINPLNAGISQLFQPTTGGQQGGGSSGGGIGDLISTGLDLFGGGSSGGFDLGDSIGGIFNSGGGGGGLGDIGGFFGSSTPTSSITSFNSGGGGGGLGSIVSGIGSFF